MAPTTKNLLAQNPRRSIKNSYPNPPHTQTPSCTLSLHRSQALKPPLALSALIALITLAHKPSLVLVAPLQNHAHRLLLLCLALVSFYFPNLPPNTPPIPLCLSQLPKKPALGCRNEAWEDIYRLSTGYRGDLDHTTRAPKDLARRIKRTQQQAKLATELWRAAKLKLVSLEKQPQQ